MQNTRSNTFPSIRAIFVLICVVMLCAEPAIANPLNSWSVSCGADKGAIRKTGKAWTFKTSRNHCQGGIFSQRAEITSKPVAPSHNGAYLFESTISMRTGSNQKFGIFSVHDSRLGCAPPLAVNVQPDGRLHLTSDIKTGPGESCIRGALSDRFSQGRLRRDGTPQKLSVLIEFNGAGGFKATVALDGKTQLSGWYDASRQPAEFQSRKFYFKHGVYSQHLFDYVMTSIDMTVTKVVVRK
jgi:hypothetical protein